MKNEVEEEEKKKKKKFKQAYLTEQGYMAKGRLELRSNQAGNGR
jgi:hypothetical protein